MKVQINNGNECKYANGEILFYDGVDGDCSEDENVVIISAKSKDYFFLMELKRAIEKAISEQKM